MEVPSNAIRFTLVLFFIGVFLAATVSLGSIPSKGYNLTVLMNVMGILAMTLLVGVVCKFSGAFKLIAFWKTRKLRR
jgi:hypothetical protein